MKKYKKDNTYCHESTGSDNYFFTLLKEEPQQRVSERLDGIVLRTSADVFTGGTKERNAMAVYVLISARFKHKCVYGESRKEIANKLGVSKYLLSNSISILSRKGLLVERSFRNGIIFECRGVRTLNRGIKSHLKPLFVFKYDSFEVIKNKIFSFSVKHAITSQKHVHERIENKYRYNDVADIRKANRYIRKYGESGSRVAVIGMRRLASKLGVSNGTICNKIKEMTDCGIIARKKIFEILDGRKKSDFLLNHYHYFHKSLFIQLIGTNYTILSKRLYSISPGQNNGG